MHYPHLLTLQLLLACSVFFQYLSEQFYDFRVVVEPVVSGVPAEADEHIMTNKWKDGVF